MISNKNKELQSATLRASTLVEVMVVMILSSVVIITAFEGMDLLTRYMRNARAEVDTDSRIVFAHNTISELCRMSDRAEQIDANQIALSNSDGVLAELILSDSMLCICRNSQYDTLLTSRVISLVYDSSACVEIIYRQDTLTFPLRENQEWGEASLENKYKYEKHKSDFAQHDGQ